MNSNIRVSNRRARVRLDLVKDKVGSKMALLDSIIQVCISKDKDDGGALVA